MYFCNQMNEKESCCNMLKRIHWKRCSLAVLLYYVYFQVFYNLIAYGVVLPGGLDIETLYSVVNNFIPTFLMFLFNMLIVIFLFKRVKVQIKIFLDVLVSLLVLFAVNLAYIFFKGFNWGIVTWAGTIFNDIFILLGVEVYHYVIKFKDSVVKEQQAKTYALTYKYDALVSQINPHFLFNSLNLLFLLIPINPEKSQKFVLLLSEMYRYILSKQSYESILLSDELCFIDLYEELISLKCNNMFKIEYENREGARGKKIIPFTVQLLVENIINHNIVSKRYPMTAKIVIGDNGFSVTNHIVSKHSKHSSKVGLHYISEMYAMHGKIIEIENLNNEFRVFVPFL